MASSNAEMARSIESREARRTRFRLAEPLESADDDPGRAQAAADVNRQRLVEVRTETGSATRRRPRAADERQP
jgi:hypothetical protein